MHIVKHSILEKNVLRYMMKIVITHYLRSNVVETPLQMFVFHIQHIVLASKIVILTKTRVHIYEGCVQYKDVLYSSSGYYFFIECLALCVQGDLLVDFLYAKIQRKELHNRKRSILSVDGYMAIYGPLNQVLSRIQNLYSVIGDFFMIMRLFKDVVFQIKNKKNTKYIQYDLIK